jgi:acetyl-CoA synthetase
MLSASSQLSDASRGRRGTFSVICRFGPVCYTTVWCARAVGETLNQANHGNWAFCEPWGGHVSSVNERVEELVARFRAPDACLGELLCDSHDPDAVAFTVVHEDFSSDPLTYGELRQRSERVAGGLRELGVAAGDSVATLMGKSADYLATVVGIWRLGAAHVPLFTAFAPPAIAMRLEGSAAKVVMTDTGQRSKLDGSAGSGTESSRRIVHRRSDPGAEIPAGDLDFEDLVSTGSTAAAVAVGGLGPMVRMYTSGTTGRPKGVAIPVAAMATWQLYLELGLYVTEEDVFWCAADPGWAYGLFSGVLAPLAAGRMSVLHEDKFSAEASWRILADLGVTNFSAAPTAYRALRVVPPTPVSLRKASSAGEPLTPEVNEWATTQLGLSVHDHYGQTEAGMVFCNHHHPDLQRPIKKGSMGIPLPGWTTEVLSPDSNVAAQPGDLGRVVIDVHRSPAAWFDGYVDAPAATSEKFSEDGRWYLTGDSGRRDDDGEYFFMSRDDDVIIMAGYRIGPFDVESIIAMHPDVQECAVIAVPDAMKGEVIEAFIALKHPVDAQDQLAEELKNRVRENLGAYAYPRSVHFVDSLPRTPSGKVQRFVLRDSRRAELAAPENG